MDRRESPSPRAQLETEKPFVPHDTIDETGRIGAIGLGFGLLASSMRHALHKGNIGTLATFTRGAPVIGICAAAPMTYMFTSRSMMNLREKNDAWAAAFGGFCMGAVAGLPLGRMTAVMGLGGFFSVFQGTFYFFGNRYDSFKEEDDEFARKEIIRRTTRVPIQQTINEIGEGRGIHPPGYEERRRQRLLDNYGIEVKPVSATTEGSR